MRLGPMTLAIVAAAALQAGPLAPRATASERPPGQGGAFVSEQGDPTAVATEVARQPGGGGGGGSGSGVVCEWTVFIEDDHELKVYETEGVEMHSVTGRWLSETCRDPATGAVTSRTVPEDGVDPAAVAQQALRSVVIPDPVIRTNPVEAELYVRVPTWLWIEAGWWHTYSATATAGAVTATVVARPVRVTWETGDGAVVTCTGPGTPWSQGLAEDVSDCAHAYTSSSDLQPDGTFALTATVEIEVAWTSNTGAAGTLDAINRSASEPVRVGEIQAIETR